MIAKKNHFGTPTIRAVASFAILFLVQLSDGQDRNFKSELYQRGIEQLLLMPKTNRTDIENGIAAGLAIDPEVSIKALVAKCKISNSVAFRAAVNSARFSVESKPILRCLPRKNFTVKDAHSIAQLAFIMGTRSEDLSLLLESCQSFLTTRDVENDFLLDKQKANKGKFSAAATRDRRTEYLRFHYNLGRLQHKGTLESTDFFQRGISEPKLKKYLHATWLTRVGTKVLTGTELLSEVKKIQPKSFSYRVLFDSLQSYAPDQIRSMIGDMMVARLIGLYFEAQLETDTNDDYMSELQDCFPTLDLFRSQFRSKSPSEIIKVAKCSQSLQTELEILEHIDSYNAKKKIEPQVLQTWRQALVNSSLQSGNLADAKTIADRFSLTISPQAILDMAVQKGDIALAKQTVDSREKFSLRDTTVLTAALLTAGRNREAKPYLDQLEKDFTLQFNKQADAKKANWIVNFVLISGWSMRDVPVTQIPIEKKVLEAFGPLVNSPGVTDTISRSLDSFTPPTTASRRLLLKMKRMLPESQQMPTLVELNQLVKRIREAPKSDHAKLRNEAIELINSPIKGVKDDFASRLAFAFATAGDKEGVQQMIQEIATAEYKSWTLFQCAKVFPPRKSVPEPEYSRRLGGGLF